MPTVRLVSADVVRPLRTAVLRPGWTTPAVYPEDETVAVHIAVFLEGADAPDGVGTIYAEPPPTDLADEIPGPAYAPDAAWRLRGMATSDAARGTGLGRLVLEACFEIVRDGGGHYLWCNARLGAVPFYERLGMATAGPEFEIEGIGPHFVMWREVVGV